MKRDSDLLHIDASLGEGGGQVLRTALTLSMITARPFTMHGIRAGRRKPGLMRQHLTCVQASQEICGARVSGADLGSTTLRFEPGPTRAGAYRFSVGTAGSVTLVLQTVLPALLHAPSESSLELEGGTHNPLAPCFDFLDRSFRPVLAKMGGVCSLELISHGFFPAGGGRIRASVQPVSDWLPLDLMEAGPVQNRRGHILLSHLGMEIGERQRRMLKNKLNWPEDCFSIQRVRPAHGPGNALILEWEQQHHTEVFTGFGAHQVTSGKVVAQLVNEVRDYMSAGAPVGEYLADQLMLLLALNKAGGQYRATKASSHSLTNAQIIELFLPGRILLESQTDKSWVVRCRL